MSPEQSGEGLPALQASGRRYEPHLQWDDGVREYLSQAFGEERFEKITRALCHPSRTSSLRVNTLTTTSQKVMGRLAEECSVQEKKEGRTREASFACWEHESVPGVVTISGSGPHQVDYRDPEGQLLKEVLISRKCGEAVLRGAEVFVPGVLACEAGVNAGDEVAVSVFVESEEAPPTRGTTLLSSDNSCPRNRWFIGRGRAVLSRAAIFRQEQGLAVGMLQRVYQHPPLYDITTTWVKGVFLQHLPSVVAARVLGPQPGERILDMCASPGGKTTAIAILMKDQGAIVALDRSQSKVQQIESLAKQMGLTCITALKMDATKCCEDRTDSQANASLRNGAEEVAESVEEAEHRRLSGEARQFADSQVSGSEPSKSGHQRDETIVTEGSNELRSNEASSQSNGCSAEPASLGSTGREDDNISLCTRTDNVSNSRCDVSNSTYDVSNSTYGVRNSTCADDIKEVAGCHPPACNGSERPNPSSVAALLAQGFDLETARIARKARRKEERTARSNRKSLKADRLEPGSFDRVLLDAPCSALGLRPRLFVGGVTLQSLRQDGVYKRRFLDQAVRLVKSGGVIVYSTCTINPGENEALVRYALDTYPCLRLVPQEPRLGGPGLVGGGDVFDGTGYRSWLREGEQELVQRFDPDGPLDTIGFFIAKFEKSKDG